MSEYRYTVEPRSEALGGGWQLRLFEGDTEVGGGVFPADPDSQPCTGIDWWNALHEDDRAKWMKVAGDTGRAVDAFAAYLREEAHCEAMDAGDSWILSDEK